MAIAALGVWLASMFIVLQVTGPWPGEHAEVLTSTSTGLVSIHILRREVDTNWQAPMEGGLPPRRETWRFRVREPWTRSLPAKAEALRERGHSLWREMLYECRMGTGPWFTTGWGWREQRTFVRFPGWIPAAVFGAWPAIAAGRRLKRRHRFPVGCCQGCGYDLRGSAGACPECGGA
ncbi:MAG: hypothetical protein WD316_08410 [Phycisphaeraceae bacterium]